MTSAASKSSNVSTIPAGMPFADALAAGLVTRCAAASESLGQCRILLPNRRALRALREAFLRQGDGAPMILPVLQPLGEVDEDEQLFLQAGRGVIDDLALPPEIPQLRRLALLARQIMRLPAGDGDGGGIATPQAIRLAAELARLMDQVETEGLDFSGLETLAPAGLAKHWQVTLEFLKIVTDHWPGVLRQEKAMNPAARRARLIDNLADAWRTAPPPGPVIAAGSTGSIPATARLLEVVSRLPRGEVILPDLDRDMPADAWQAVNDSHPQFMLKQLLERMGVDRAEVSDWRAGEAFDKQAAILAPRLALVREALAPAERTENWRNVAGSFDARTKSEIRLVKCPGLREEAGTIALIMREALETEGARAALITPDRQLARRVKSELGRWGIDIDDSAGRPLALTPPANFLRLLAEAVSGKLAPVPLLALLKHPLAAAGGERTAFLGALRGLEKDRLRGPRPAPGLDGLTAASKSGGRGKAHGKVVKETLKRLARCLRPLEKAFGKKVVALADLLETFIAAAEALAASADEPGAARLWAGENGEATARFIEELRDAAPLLGEVAPTELPALLENLMAGRVVRPRRGAPPRLAIWGAIEARMQHADLIILGGLNEQSWPPAAGSDPWMSRPMREKFGLPAPERRIGQSAHDFVQALGAPRVVLTRSEKVDGAPTVPSRWLLRLEALAGPLTGGTETWLHWFEALDRSEKTLPVKPPRPTPPVDARPTKLSVTRVERWMRDPYALYAEQILRLQPLDALDKAPGPAERGTIFHQALENFIKRPAGGDVDAFLEEGKRAFGKTLDQPAVRAFWWPRFERVAATFAEIQEKRAGRYSIVAVEVKGELRVEGPAGDFVLTAKADRIDLRLEDRTLEIIDYKTGKPPGGKQIAAGFAPQLPLEALMAEAGAFNDIEAAPVASLKYWQLSGGNPAVEIIWPRDLDVGEETARARKGLLDLITLFSAPGTPYLSNPRPAYTGYGDYDHLARVKEWQDEDRPRSDGEKGA